MSAGSLITLEGVGGSGKSSVAKLITEWIGARGVSVLLLKEPGATPLGQALRRILLEGTEPLAPWTEAFLFEADRAEAYATKVVPALRDGTTVVFDRGPYGTYAYQGYGRNLDLGLIDAMSAAATLGVARDLAIVIDVPVALGLERKRMQTETDRFDAEPDIAYHERVRAGYLAAAERDANAAVVVDGSRDLPSVVSEVTRIIEERGLVGGEG